MTTRDLHSRPQDESVGTESSDRREAILVGGLLGGLLSGLLLYAAGKLHLVLLGSIVGITSVSGGFVAWLILSLVLGGVYAGVAEDRFDVGDDPGTDATYGLGFGLAAAVLLGMVAVPGLAGADVPAINTTAIAAYLLLGVVTAVGYGASLRDAVPDVSIGSERTWAVVVGSLAGGLLSGVVFYTTAKGFLYQFGLIVGVGFDLTTSFVVWLVVAVGLGVVFLRTAAPTVGRGEDEMEGYATVGAVFGATAGIVVGMVLVPAVVGASTGLSPSVPYVDLTMLVGFLLYGVVLGAGYGAARGEAVDLPAYGSPTQRALAFGSLFGAFTGGLVIHQLAGSVWMLYFGSIVGSFTYTGSWLVWIVLSGVMGVGFQYGLAGNLDTYVEDLRDAVGSSGPLAGAMDDAEFTTTATVVGAVYGVVVAVVVGMILVPVVVTSTSGLSMPLPTTEAMVLAGYVVYGAFLGLGYGTLIEF